MNGEYIIGAICGLILACLFAVAYSVGQGSVISECRVLVKAEHNNIVINCTVEKETNGRD